ncbi:MAG TPA: alpha/beta hydrolase [Anaerolineae bacterium]
MEPVQEKFIALNGLQFHYLDWGKTDAPVIIALHGFTSLARTWDTVARALSDRYRFLALDQRGHGETEWADSYTLNSALGDLEAFVSALGVKSFVLLGHSMGGWISYTYAPSHPAQVVRLIIVDMGPEIMPAFAQRLSSSLDAGDVFESHEHVLRKMRAENSRASDEELFHRAKHNVKQRQDGKWTWRYDRGFRDGSRPIERLAPAQQWQSLARITCPTLLVRGAETDLLARETALRMVSTIPNCRYVEIQHAGHSVFMDNPTDFIAAVNEFLSAYS